MQIDWFTFVAQIINFLILLWLLKTFLYGPLIKVMENREDKISSRLEEARIKLEEAEQKMNVYQEKLKKLEEQKSGMLNNAREETESYKRELMQKARDEVEKVRQKWMKAIETEKAMFLEELEKQSVGKILEIVEHIIRDLADFSLEQQAVDRFLRELRQVDGEERKQMMRAVGSEQIEVAMAFPADESHRSKINAAIKQVFDSESECRFNHVPDLGFGIELRSNGWKVGWSLKSYLDKLRTEVESQFDRLDVQTKS